MNINTRLKRTLPKPTHDSAPSLGTSENEIRSCTLMLFGNTSTVHFGSTNILLGPKQPAVHQAGSSLIVPIERKVYGHNISLISVLGLKEAEISVDQNLWKLINKNSIHAFIFLLNLDNVTDDDMVHLEWLQMKFGERVLQFVMILFTYEKEEKNDTIIDYLNENPALEHLLKECKYRYHTCSKNMSIQSEIRSLLEKIDDIMTDNGQTGYTAEMFLQHNQSESAQAKTVTAVRKMNSNMRPTHFNIILVGQNGAGKSSTGNTLLGRESFSVKRTQQTVSSNVHKDTVTIDGSCFNVYDTPGQYEQAVKEEELIKNLQVFHQLDESFPTVILIVLKAEIPTKERKLNLEIITKQLDLLKSKYKKTAELIENLPNWLRQNTWLLFTGGDELERENLTIEEIINQTEESKRFVRKLQNRYHVFNNKSSKNSQVIQLIEKINGVSLKMPPKINHFPRTVCPIPERNPNERRIVLLGKTGAGKSATANTILGKKRFVSELCPSSVTTESEMEQVVVAGRNVTIVDTPGLFDTSISAEDLAIEIGKSIYLSSPGPHAFLYVLQIDLRFTEQEEEVIHKFELMFGQEMRKYTIILFTHGDQLEGKSPEDLIKINSTLNKLVDKCGGGFHVFNNKEQSNRDQVILLLEKIEGMVEKNGGSCYCNQMYADAARFRKEAEERKQIKTEGNKNKTKKYKSQNNVVKVGMQFFEGAVKIKQKTRKYIQELRQEEMQHEKKESQVREHKGIGRLRQEQMNAWKKAEKKEPKVKAKMHIFEQPVSLKREGKNRQNEREEKKQQDQRKEKKEPTNNDTAVRDKVHKFDKYARNNNQKEQLGGTDRALTGQTVKEKEQSVEIEDEGVKVKKQMFEKFVTCRREEQKQWKKEKETQKKEKKQEVENIKKETGMKVKLHMFEKPKCAQEEEEKWQNEWKRKQSEEKEEEQEEEEEEGDDDDEEEGDDDDEEEGDDEEEEEEEEEDEDEEKEEEEEEVVEEKEEEEALKKATTPNQDRSKNTWIEEVKRKHNEERKEESDTSIKKSGLKAKMMMFEKGCWREEQENQRQKEEEDRKQREESEQKQKSLNKETDVRCKMQTFEKEIQKPEKEETKDEEVVEKVQREEKRKSEETGVKVKMQMFEKASWKPAEEESRNKEELERRKWEKKQKSVNEEIDVKVKMFEKSIYKQVKEDSRNTKEVERNQSEEKIKRIYKETEMEIKMIEKAVCITVDGGMRKQVEKERQEISRYTETAVITPECDVKTDGQRKDCHEQKQRQVDNLQKEHGPENEALVDQKLESDQGLPTSTSKKKNKKTKRTNKKADPGLENFLKEHGNHLSAAGHVGLTFRQQVAQGASAGLTAGVSLGSTVGMALGPVGAAVGSVIGGFLGGVGGAVGSMFRAILK